MGWLGRDPAGSSAHNISAPRVHHLELVLSREIEPMVLAFKIREQVNGRATEPLRHLFQPRLQFGLIDEGPDLPEPCLRRHLKSSLGRMGGDLGHL